MAIAQETRLKKAHIALMKHPETALYSGVILMGKSVVEDGIPTAYTNGRDKKYGREFISKLSDPQLRGLILHENLHVALKHIGRFTKEFKDSPMLINVATDYAVNDVIKSMEDKEFCQLPEGGLYDEKFHNWSAREIYNYLKSTLPHPPKIHISFGDGDGKGQGKEGQGQGKEGQGKSIKISIDGKESTVQTTDEHDFDAKEMSPAEQAELSDSIDRALREGGILAGRMGAKVPRQIGDLLEPKVNWRDALREFVTSSTRGSDEYTWRKFNKRMMANDLYMPSMENESVGELVIAIDTSGSIGGVELTEFATELASICDAVSPSKIRVLWWDTAVHGEQVFQDNYTNIKDMLKPQGGGGTHVGCVSDYVVQNKIPCEGVLVFTDGYVESDIKWDITAPTLWLVTQRRDFQPPMGGKVVKKED
jgi:predicted metal-dependent peptidase